jgi:lipopolysaccharide/colanic/teichoic acid biosynthesis glycosyltransferase
VPASGQSLQRVIKRLIDLAGSVFLLLVFAPLIALIAMMLLLRNGTPVIYRETRTGRHGGPFTLRKFRTLHAGTGSASSVAAEGDARILPLGQFLRRWRLDEFPQLLNVLTGDMSLVGPRPLPQAHIQSVPDAISREILAVAPGLTGQASILYLAEDAVLAGRPDAERCYLAAILPAKLEAEREYLRHWSLFSDLRILFLTLLWVWSPRARKQSYERVAALVQDAPGGHGG